MRFSPRPPQPEPSDPEFTWGGAGFFWNKTEKVFVGRGDNPCWTGRAWPTGLKWGASISVMDGNVALDLPRGQGRTPQEALLNSLQNTKDLLTNLELRVST